MDTNPRFVVDVDGDGMADLVGCSTTGVFLSFSSGKDTDGNPLDFLPSFWAHN